MNEVIHEKNRWPNSHFVWDLSKSQNTFSWYIRFSVVSAKISWERGGGGGTLLRKNKKFFFSTSFTLNIDFFLKQNVILKFQKTFPVVSWVLTTIQANFLQKQVCFKTKKNNYEFIVTFLTILRSRNASCFLFPTSLYDVKIHSQKKAKDILYQ